MSKDEQAMKLLKLANEIDRALTEPDILQDTYGFSDALRFHLDGATFAAVERLSRITPSTDYQNACVHAKIKIGPTV